MKKWLRIKLLFIPLVILAIFTLVMPYFTFGLYPKSTTMYVYFGIIAFFSIVRLKGSYTNKTIDKIITILIWIISVPVFIILGSVGVVIINVFPSATYLTIYFMAITVSYIFGIRFKIIGNAPSEQIILAPNHCSTIDDILPPILFGTKLKWKVLFAQEITRIPFVGAILKKVGIPILRSDSDSRRCASEKMMKVIKDGSSILIYPEGRRLRVEDEDLMLSPFHVGAFVLSTKNKIPVIPVAIYGTFYFKPRSGQWWFSPRKIKIKYLEPMLSMEDENPEQFAERARSVLLKELTLMRE